VLTARLRLLRASLFALAVAACAPSTSPPPAAPIAPPERAAPAASSPAPPAPTLRPSHCVSALARPGDPIAVAWPAGPFASAFWIVDQLSGWDDHYTSAVYPSWWHKRFPADVRADELLRDYAAVRRAHALAPSTEPDVAHPDDVLAPAAAPADRFAATALCAAGPAEAAAALGLTAAESRAFTAAFEQLAPRIDEVLTVGGDADRYFKGLFWGRSRWQFDTVARFAALSERGPSISRWVVGTAADLGAQPEIARDAKMRSLDDARAALGSSKATGCVAARRRPSGLGWDVAVVGRDRDGLRGALIAVVRGMEIPERKPLCLAARR
jgi:hypothetical protein